MAHTTIDHTMISMARGVAYGAHAGQFDKAGRPYILHPQRVAGKFTDPMRAVIAWLHDVVEDTQVTLRDLLDAGFPPEVVARVDAMTHRKNEPREDYCRRVLLYPETRDVKLEDIADNGSEERLRYLPAATQERLRAKYARDLVTLGAS
jgi:(p)ppGpp synthase/HD superfamily hydrolase